MKPVDKDPPESAHHTYMPSMTEKPFDSVELLEDAKVKVRIGSGKCEAEDSPFSLARLTGGV